MTPFGNRFFNEEDDDDDIQSILNQNALTSGLRDAGSVVQVAKTVGEEGENTVIHHERFETSQSNRQPKCTSTKEAQFQGVDSGSA